MIVWNGNDHKTPPYPSPYKCTQISYSRERLVYEYDSTGDLLADLGSDQTSCHNPFLGGYYPVQLSYDEARTVMHGDPARFRQLVEESLRRHIAAINHISAKGLYFWDYGNAFLLEASRAGKSHVWVGWHEGASKPRLITHKSMLCCNW